MKIDLYKKFLFVYRNEMIMLHDQFDIDISNSKRCNATTMMYMYVYKNDNLNK